MSANGVFGDWTVDGPALAWDEICALPAGTEVEVVWSGGNGPHRYRIVHRDGPYLVRMREDLHGPMRYYNPLSDFVGTHPPRTEVRLCAQRLP